MPAPSHCDGPPLPPLVRALLALDTLLDAVLTTFRPREGTVGRVLVG